VPIIHPNKGVEYIVFQTEDFAFYILVDEWKSTVYHLDVTVDIE
jgi:hypothetical protein